MKIKRSFLLLSLLLAFSLIFTACSNTAPDGGTSDNTESSSESQPPESREELDSNNLESAGAARLKMTLNGEQVVMAELVDSPATEEFLAQLPFTVNMNEHLERQKEVYLPFSLSEENLQNSVTEYEIGDIVYWHPGPTMGIFTDHDGRSISAGVEILARLDEDGVAAFASYPDEVEVLFEVETDEAQSSTQGERQLTITLEDADVIYAALLDTPAANAFAEQLPLTLDMTDYLEREKHASLNFSIDDSDLMNIQTPYEIGDIIYYPPGPTFAMYYDHDGREISAGFELIARMDQTGIETLATYPNAVKVTVELSE